MLIEWNDEFSVKIDAVDEEHKKLFDVMNRFHSAMTGRQVGSIIEDIFNELIDYTKTHFAHEESMLESVKFPKLAEHQKLHQDFVDKLNDLKAQFDSNPQSFTISIEIWILLRNWLNQHILGADMEYSSYF